MHSVESLALFFDVELGKKATYGWSDQVSELLDALLFDDSGSSEIDKEGTSREGVHLDGTKQLTDKEKRIYPS